MGPSGTVPGRSTTRGDAQTTILPHAHPNLELDGHAARVQSLARSFSRSTMSILMQASWDFPTLLAQAPLSSSCRPSLQDKGACASNVCLLQFVGCKFAAVRRALIDADPGRYCERWLPAERRAADD